MKTNIQQGVLLINHSSSSITDYDIARVLKVLQRNHVGIGEEVIGLEEAFRNRFNRKFAIAVNSGSAALKLSLLALDLPEGAKLVTSAYVCSSVVNVVMAEGLEPEFIDVGKNDVNIDSRELQECARSKGSPLGAIIVPYIGGYATDISETIKAGIPIIEDCAASVGARTARGEVGALGTLSTFSFGSTKAITGGSGGMILTDSDTCHFRIRELMAYDNPEAIRKACGCNFLMNDLQAALVSSQFGRLDDILEARKMIACRYDELLSGKDNIVVVRSTDVEPSFYRYVFLAKEKNRMLEQLRSEGIDARGSVAHFMGDYSPIPSGRCPGAERLEKEMISLPVYPNLKSTELNKILNVLEKIIN